MPADQRKVIAPRMGRLTQSDPVDRREPGMGLVQRLDSHSGVLSLIRAKLLR